MTDDEIRSELGEYYGVTVPDDKSPHEVQAAVFRDLHRYQEETIKQLGGVIRTHLDTIQKQQDRIKSLEEALATQHADHHTTMLELQERLRSMTSAFDHTSWLLAKCRSR